MQEELVTTIITNLQDNGRTVHWTAKKPMWLNPHTETVIPYEIWSVANKVQRESIVAECRDKYVTLTIRIVSAIGNVVDIPFDPSVQIAKEEPKKVQNIVRNIAAEFAEDDKNHTIVASTGESAVAAQHLGLTAETVTAPTADAITIDGASTSGFTVDKDTAVSSTLAKLDYATDAMEAGKQKFAELVAVKDWAGALDVLIKLYGKDKITFTARTIMTMKDFDTIVAKYNL